jgi:ABC-type uncharacterized transport system permease subunit
MAAIKAEMRDAPKARPAPTKMSWAWVGIMPFFLFALLFLIYPSSTIAIKFQIQPPMIYFKYILGFLQAPIFYKLIGSVSRSA